jgi:hypothetical protein
MPDDDRQWVIDAAKTVPGVLDAYHLLDPDTGNGLSIAFYDDDVDVAEVKAAISRKADEIGWHDAPRPAPRSESIYRVVRRDRCPRSRWSRPGSTGVKNRRSGRVWPPGSRQIR